MRQTPRSPAKRSTPHPCSHKMHSLRSFSMLKSITCLLVPSSLDGGFRCQGRKTRTLKPEISVFVICIFYSFNTSPSLLPKLFSFVPVYSFVFPGYTIKRVGFGKSPYGPYPIETSLDLPHPCRSRKGGALFVVVILNEWRLLILSFFA